MKEPIIIQLSGLKWSKKPVKCIKVVKSEVKIRAFWWLSTQHR